MATPFANEFKEMVNHLHGAGLEVVLDVVYNHTAEGNEGGPTLSFRASTTASYYAWRKQAPLHQRHRHRQHRQPQPSERAADGRRSLRYWATEDAHRRLPASTWRPSWRREPYGFDRAAGFLDCLPADPVLSEA